MLKLNVTWRDRRLDYLNLREDIYQNMLPDDEKENIWKPEIGKKLLCSNCFLYIFLCFNSIITIFDFSDLKIDK